MKEKKEKTKVTNKKVKIIKIVIAVILGIALISVGIYFGVKAYGDYKEKKSYNDLSDYMNEDNEDKVEEVEKTAKMIKLEELHNQYPDVVAWLDIPGTTVSFPVVQKKDSDTYYLTHTYKDEYSARGSIFANSKVDFDRPSENFLIYGHRNKNGAMFEPIINYEKEEFYKEHTKINLTTLHDDSEYEVLAAFRSRVYYKSETNVFRYYHFMNAENEQEYNDFVSNAKAASMYETGVTASYGDQLLTLSTCAYHCDYGRFAVVAKKVS